MTTAKAGGAARVLRRILRSPRAINWRRHRPVRRGAAAAAAVTLAAGMAAAPALAAVPDPSTDQQPSSSPIDGTKVAQGMRVPMERFEPFEPLPQRPFRSDLPPGQVSPFPRQQPVPRRDGPLDPGTEQQLRDAEGHRVIGERADEIPRHVEEEQQHRNEEAFENPHKVPGVNDVLHPSVDMTDSEKARVAQRFAQDEGLSYVNHYFDDPFRGVVELSLTPTARMFLKADQKAELLGRLDQSYMMYEHPEETAAYKQRLVGLLDQIEKAKEFTSEDLRARDDAIEEYNRVADRFNDLEYGVQRDSDVPRARPPKAMEDRWAAEAEAAAAARERVRDLAINEALEADLEGGPVNTGEEEAARQRVHDLAVKESLEADMEGGGVNTGEPDTNPGPVGDDPGRRAAADERMTQMLQQLTSSIRDLSATPGPAEPMSQMMMMMMLMMSARATPAPENAPQPAPPVINVVPMVRRSSVEAPPEEPTVAPPLPERRPPMSEVDDPAEDADSDAVAAKEPDTDLVAVSDTAPDQESGEDTPASGDDDGSSDNADSGDSADSDSAGSADSGDSADSDDGDGADSGDSAGAGDSGDSASSGGSGDSGDSASSSDSGGSGDSGDSAGSGDSGDSGGTASSGSFGGSSGSDGGDGGSSSSGGDGGGGD